MNQKRYSFFLFLIIVGSISNSCAMFGRRRGKTQSMIPKVEAESFRHPEIEYPKEVTIQQLWDEHSYLKGELEKIKKLAAQGEELAQELEDAETELLYNETRLVDLIENEKEDERKKLLAKTEENIGKWHTAYKLAEQTALEKEDRLARDRMQKEDELARERMKVENQLARNRNEEFNETLKETPLQVGVHLSDNTTNLRLDDEFWKNFRKHSKNLVEAMAPIIREIALENNKHDLKKLPFTLRHDARMKKIDHANRMETLHFWKGAASDYLSDSTKIGATIGLIGGGAFIYYGGKYGTRVVADYAASRLGKPKLVTETSRRSLLGRFNPRDLSKRWFSRHDTTQNSLPNVILSPELEKEMIHYGSGLKNTKKNNGYFTHSLFYGSPGTGKTLVAKTIAKNAGMHYAILSGSNILQYKNGEDKAQVNKLFDWAETNKEGTVLFLDEAEVVLPDRESPKVSEQVSEIVTTILARTGTESDKFSLVLATNRPHVLDKAVLDRIDNKWEFGLPQFQERKEILSLYIDKWLKNNPKIKSPITVTDLSESKVTSIARKTDGFSGRELSKMVIAWQQAAFRTSDNILDEPAIDRVVEQKLKQHSVQKFKTYLS